MNRGPGTQRLLSSPPRPRRVVSATLPRAEMEEEEEKRRSQSAKAPPTADELPKAPDQVGNARKITGGCCRGDDRWVLLGR